MLSIGIVGLPNVGKSTLFEALTKKQVDRSNYPFCTIDPNVGVVAVPDDRIEKIAAVTGADKKIYTAIEFFDIAGLIAGASRGEGLGNYFLAQIRNTDALLYLLRVFRDENIVNTRAIIDPLAEKDILDTEMALKDLETVEKRLETLENEIKRKVKEALKEKEILEKAKDLLASNRNLRQENWNQEEEIILKNYQLLTLKPCLCLLNGRDQEVAESIKQVFKENNWPFLIIDILAELEGQEFSNQERKDLGLPEVLELDQLIKKSYELLDLITFFTIKSGEVRAWTVERGTKVPRAGGTIHSDFDQFFIKAEVINWKDLVESGGEAQAREKGLIRTEGRDYLVCEGDIIEIKHSPPKT